MNRTLLRRRLALFTGSTFLLATSLACGASGDDAPPAPTADESIRILSVTYGTALQADGLHVETPVERFTPFDPLATSIVVAGRPVGVVTARVDVYGQVLEREYDLAQLNQGVVWSAGTNTILGGSFRHEAPLPQGHFETVILHDGVVIGRYPFEIGPPPDASPTVVHLARFSNRVLDTGCVGPAQDALFANGDVVFGVFVNAGRGAHIRMVWRHDDEEIAATNRISPSNQSDVCFTDTQHPAGGWTPGDYRVSLIVNGRDVGMYPFTVVPPE